MAEINEVEWHSGWRKVKRQGFFGPLLDLIFPIKEPTGFCGFVVTTTDGVVYTSADGVEWTVRPATLSVIKYAISRRNPDNE